MTPCANWKGYLKLSLVSGPVALFPATTARDRVRFNAINRETDHRVRCAAGRKKLERAS